jgi:hypothetical protein
VGSIWSEQTGPSPLWNGARRASSDVPGAPADGLQTPSASVVISSQTGSSGAPEITDDQRCSGGPSERASQHHWRLGTPSAELRASGSSVTDPRGQSMFSWRAAWLPTRCPTGSDQSDRGRRLEPMICTTFRLRTALVAIGLVQPHSWDLSTANSQPGEDGSKPCSISHRAATRLRNDHHARITSKSTSVP